MKTTEQIKQGVGVIFKAFEVAGQIIQKKHMPAFAGFGYSDEMVWLFACDKEKRILGFQTIHEPASGAPIENYGGVFDAPTDRGEFITHIKQSLNLDATEALAHLDGKIKSIPPNLPCIRAFFRVIYAMPGHQSASRN